MLPASMAAVRQPNSTLAQACCRPARTQTEPDFTVASCCNYPACYRPAHWHRPAAGQHGCSRAAQQHTGTGLLPASMAAVGLPNSTLAQACCRPAWLQSGYPTAHWHRPAAGQHVHKRSLTSNFLKGRRMDGDEKLIFGLRLYL